MKENTEDFNKYYEIDKKNENEIGRGPRFGIIYYAIKKKADEKKVDEKKADEKKAIKIMEKSRIIGYLRARGIAEPKETDIDFYFKGFLREAHNMEILQGKKKQNMNAVFIDEFYNTKNEFAIVMEKCDNNLFNHLADRNEPFNSGEIYEILKQLNNSFKIMVEKKILHRAIKPQNILLKYLNKEKTKFIVKLKITDDSCSLNDASNLLSSVIENNNLSISSPEILKGEKEIEKCDLWSIGILIYTLYFRIFPFEGNDENELLENINSTIEEGKLRNINDDKLKDLVKKLLKINPKDRISWDKYFNHPFFIENPKNNYENFYTKIEIIGVGKFGYVYKGIKNDTREERAIKIISKINYNTYVSNLEETSYTTFIQSLENEIDNMIIAQGINGDNQNSIKLYEYFNMRDEFVIIMELCDCNLADYFKKKSGNFNFNEIREILTQLNNTFKILVNNKVIHRDLKLQNILLKKNNGQNIWKLADYGVSKQLITFNEQTYTSGIGTPLYMAPEVCEGLKCCHKCDLWSLGIIIYKLYFKEEPYKGDTIVAILNHIKTFGKKSLQSSDNKYFDDLIQKLLEENPKNRISWEEYFDHDFFKKIL